MYTEVQITENLRSSAAQFTERAVEYTARFLTGEFTTIKHLEKFLTPQCQIFTPVKTEYVPMKVLFKDKKYISETIEILCQLVKDASLNGRNQVRHAMIMKAQVSYSAHVHKLIRLW